MSRNQTFGVIVSRLKYTHNIMFNIVSDLKWNLLYYLMAQLNSVKTNAPCCFFTACRKTIQHIVYRDEKNQPDLRSYLLQL